MLLKVSDSDDGDEGWWVVIVKVSDSDEGDAGWWVVMVVLVIVCDSLVVMMGENSVM